VSTSLMCFSTWKKSMYSSKLIPCTTTTTANMFWKHPKN